MQSLGAFDTTGVSVIRAGARMERERDENGILDAKTKGVTP
jgi:hypothetical protein